jgi:hypothetical protein
METKGWFIMALNKNTIMVGLILLGLLILYAFASNPFSIVTPPVQGKMVSGEVIWYTTVTGDDINSGISFLPDSYKVTKSDVTSGQSGSLTEGTYVTPKDAAMIYVTKGDNSCTYSLTKKTFTLAYFFTQAYYELGNPSRNIMVTVCETGFCKEVNAANIGETPITFGKAPAQLTVKGLGTFSGNKNCPEYSNVALVYDKNGVPYFKDKIDMLAKANSIGSLNILIYGGISDNTAFISGFDKDSKLVVNSQGNLLTGKMPGLSLGSAVLSITANAAYFKSAYIIPAQQADPKISSVAISSISAQGVGTARVTLTNQNDNEGAVSVKVTAEKSVVDPESQIITLKDSSVLSYRIIPTTIASGGSDKLTVTACTTSQVGSPVCDTVSKSFTVSSSGSGSSSSCGNKVCEPGLGETTTSCSLDCKASEGTTVEPQTCDDKLGGLVLSSPETTGSCGFFCNLGLSKASTVSGCSYNYTPLVIVLLIFAAVVVYFATRKRK